ncbi:MAG: hypothetical protein RLY40_389 [Pseudomonadota bacterium]|jgi:hypothetical protein
MKNLATAWDLDESYAIILGSIAAIGNGIPGAGFSIKGINSTAKKLMSLEKPSWISALFMLPASFSGFTTHKASADSFIAMGLDGPFVSFLNWNSNFGSVLFFNSPQLLALADRIKNHQPIENDHGNDLQQILLTEVQNLNSLQEIKGFKQASNINKFFNTSENTNLVNYPSSYAAINNSRV